MAKRLHWEVIDNQIVGLLASNPEGQSGHELRQRIHPPISQPSLSRRLKRLMSRGLVTKTGRTRDARYHLVDGPLARARLRSRRLHELAAEEIVRDPRVIEVVRERLQKLREVNPSGRRYHDQWQELIDGDIHRLLRLMTSDSDEMAQLRKESPMTVLVPKQRRDALFRQMSGAH